MEFVFGLILLFILFKIVEGLCNLSAANAQDRMMERARQEVQDRDISNVPYIHAITRDVAKTKIINREIGRWKEEARQDPHLNLINVLLMLEEMEGYPKEYWVMFSEWSVQEPKTIVQRILDLAVEELNRRASYDSILNA